MISDPQAADLPSDNVRAAAAHSPVTPAAITQPHRDELALSGCWTALGIGTLDRQLDALPVSRQAQIVVDGARVEALDTVGVWVLQRLLERVRGEGSTVRLNGWRPEHTKLLDLLAQHAAPSTPVPPRPRPALERLGRATVTTLEQISALLSFVGESAAALAGSVAHPARVRWRTILHDIQSAGFNALPIVGLLSFLLGIVVAYQGAEQLRRYGANIFVADLVGWSMLREFAPLITAIIVAGRSGSAYAAQIGTMAVTEEIDAMRTLGIAPLDVLVLPKNSRAADRAAALDRVCRRARRIRRHDHGARAARRWLWGVSRPLGQCHPAVHVLARHRQGAGVRRHYRGSRLFSRASSRTAAPTASAVRPRAPSCRPSSW